jgi:hypothetical protein
MPAGLGKEERMQFDPRVARRAGELTPEEQAAGSDDREAQADEILAESDERTDAPRAEERRTSEETVEPPPDE